MTVAPSRKNPLMEYMSRLKTDFQKNTMKYTFVLPVLIFFLYFLVFPVALVFIASIRLEDGSYSLSTFKEILSSEKFINWNGGEQNEWISSDEIEYRGETETWITLNGKNYGVILNSLLIAFLTTFLSLIIGTCLALFMAKREFIGKKIVSVCILIPLIIPPFVGGVGFKTMMQRDGIINEHFLAPVFGVRLFIEGTFALVFVEAFHYYTLVYLNVYSSLINVDPSMEEAAKNLGAKGFRLLRTVTLPLALPGIAAGTILVFILSLEDLGTPILFALTGDTIARNTMTFYIFENLEVFNPNSRNVITPDSAVIGSLLLFFSIIGFIIIRKYVSMRSYAMSGKGRAGDRSIPKASVLETVIFYLIYSIIFFLSILIHVGLLIRAFSAPGANPRDFPPKWSTENFDKIFSSSQNIRPYISNTLTYSFLALFVILIFGTMAAYAIARYDFKGKAAFDTLITIPIALPGVVIGLGYLVMFSGSFVIDPLSIFGRRSTILFTFDPFVYPVILLICSYAVRKFPFAVRSIYAGLQQTSVELEEASINLGASRGYTLASITMPLITLNLVAGSLIALVYTLSEVSTTIVLIQDQDQGTITWYMGNYGPDQLNVYAAMGVLLMVLQIISLVVSSVLLRNRAEAMTGI